MENGTIESFFCIASTYAAWNVWEQAIWNTSDSYGMALGERFGSGGKRSPLIGVGSGAAIMQITMMGSAPLCARAE
jgi:hypothetical protein